MSPTLSSLHGIEGANWRRMFEYSHSVLCVVTRDRYHKANRFMQRRLTDIGIPKYYVPRCSGQSSILPCQRGESESHSFANYDLSAFPNVG